MRIVVQRLRTVRQLVGLVFRSDPWRTVLALAPVIPASTALSYVAGRRLIAALAASDTTAMTTGAVLFTIAFVGTVWLGRVVRTTRIQLGELTVAEFNRRRVAAVLAPSRIEHLERPEYLDRLETIRSRTFEIGQTPRMLGWLVDSGGGIVASAILLASIEPLLSLVVLGGLPPAIVGARAQRRIDAVNAANAPSNRRALHLYDVATRAGDAKEIRVFGLGDELLRRFEQEWRGASRRLVRAEVAAGLVNGAGWVLQSAVFALGVAALIGNVERGEANAADVFVGLGAMAMVVGQFGQAAGGLSNIGRVSGLFDDLRHLEGELERQRPPGVDREVPDRIERGVALRGVSYRYPGGDHDALTDVDLDLPAGRVVAIVGDNGAGKSTLVKLLFGLYEPTAGAIDVDGVPLSTTDQQEWRARTSACFQDFVRLELVARESIGAGDVPRIDDDEALARATSRAAATATIDGLPERFDHQLGSRFGGTDLSGGQWQKLAISRAMMRPTPLLLALDEPTGALDPLAELEIFRSYTAVARELAASAGTITVLVSHRFSTVRMADLIVVLDRGRVREVGSHNELMASAGLYAELYELQARHYR